MTPEQRAATVLDPLGNWFASNPKVVAAVASAIRDAERAAYERAAKEISCGCNNAQAVVNASGAERWRLCGDPSCGALAAASILALIDKETT
jgi:hypothetical protein